MNMKNISFSIIILILFINYQCKKDISAVNSLQFTWHESSPEKQGLDTKKLDSAMIQVANTEYIDGLVVIRNGFIVKERYFNGFDKTTPHNVMSVSKSFLSAITGIAVHKGFIDSLSEKMLDYFPEYIYTGIDPRKYNITIEHLLTMRMGIRGESENNYSVYQSIYTSGNWIKTTIEYPLNYNPGEQFHYNTFQTHLLSGIITKATQKSTKEFMTENLLKPMSIDVDEWERDPQGYYFGGNAMHFTPREMAVLGYLYLNNGKLNNRRIVPESWVYHTLSPSTNFSHPNQWGELKNYNYAYLWWLGQIGGFDIFMALGYGGQYIIVFPNIDLIVVATSENQVYSITANEQELGVLNIVKSYIVTALK